MTAAPYALMILSSAAAAGCMMLWMRLLGLAFGGSPETSVAVLAGELAALALGAVLAAVLLRRKRGDLRTFGVLQIAAGVASAVLPAAAPLARALNAWAIAAFGEGGATQLARVLGAFALVVIPCAAAGAGLPLLAAWASRSGGGRSRAGGLMRSAAATGSSLGVLACFFAVAPALSLAGADAVFAVTLVATGALSMSLGRRYGAQPPLAGAQAGEKPFVIRRFGVGPSDETQTDLEPIASPVDEERPTDSQIQPVSSEDLTPPAPEEPVTFEAADTQTDAQAVGEISTRAGSAGLAAAALAGAAEGLAAVALARAFALSSGVTAEAWVLAAAALLAARALGAAVLARRAERSGDPVGALALAALVGAVALLVCAPALPLVAAAAEATSGGLAALRAADFAAALAFALVPFGAASAVAALAAAAFSRARPASAPSAAWASLATRLGLFAGLGAAATSLGPALDLGSALRLSGWMLAGSGVLAAAFAAGRSDRRFAAAVAALVVACLLAQQTPVPPYRRPPAGARGIEGETRFLGEGRSSVAEVLSLPRENVLRVDGRDEATDLGDLPAQVMLAHLPLLLRGEPESVVLLGSGAGATARSVLTHPVKSLAVVEHRPEVLAAARAFERTSGEGLPASADGRLSFESASPRGWLAAGGDRADVILCRVARANSPFESDMLTAEAFADARRRLAERGMFCLSLRIGGMTKAQLFGVVRAFVGSFELVSMWEAAPGDEYLLLAEQPGAGGAASNLDVERIGAAMKAPAVAEDLARVGISDAADLLGAFYAPRDALSQACAEHPTARDDALAMNCGAREAMAQRLLVTFNPNFYRGDVVQWCSSLGGADDLAALIERFARIRASREMAVIARQFDALGMPRRAEAAARESLRLDPRSYTAMLAADDERFARAESFMRAKDPSRAMGLLEEVTPRNRSERRLLERSRAGALAERASRLMASGDEDSALADSERSIALAPRSVEVLLARAELLRSAKDYRGAIEAAESAIESSPNNLDLLAFKADCYRLAGEPRRAEELLEAPLRANPGSAALLAARGRAAADLGRSSEALDCFEAAVNASGGSGELRAERGRALLAAGDYARAAVDLSAALAFRPSEGALRLDLARAIFALAVKDVKERLIPGAREKMALARTHCIVAMESGASEAEARMLLARIALPFGTLDEVERNLRRAAELGTEPDERFLKALDEKRRRSTGPAHDSPPPPAASGDAGGPEP